MAVENRNSFVPSPTRRLRTSEVSQIRGLGVTRPSEAASGLLPPSVPSLTLRRLRALQRKLLRHFRIRPRI